MEIVVRSSKPKAVELVEWLTRKGVEKVAKEHQKAIEEKDTLLSDDLVIEQEHPRQLEYTNIGLQGEIRAKNQEIWRRQEEVQDLIANRHVPQRHPIDNILCFVEKKK